VRHIRFQHEHLPAAEPMPCRAGLDRQLAPKAMNHHLTRGSVLRQPTAWLEGEQQHPKRPAMNQPRLPMAIPGRVRLRAQGAGEIRKIERNHGSREPGTRMRPQPLVWLIHVRPPKIEMIE
jgi:hypothetical protein